MTVMIVWMLMSSAAEAAPRDAFGLDAQSSSRAMAVTASAEPVAAASTNPARLVDAAAIETSIGIVVADDQLKVNRSDADLDTYVGYEIGIAAVLPLGSIRDRLFIGANVHLPHGRLYDVQNSAVAEPVILSTGADARRLTLDAALAVRIWERICVGAGVHLIPDVTANVNIDFSGNSDLSSSHVSVNYRLLPVIGLYAEPVEGLHVGFSYHAAGRLSLDVPAKTYLSESIGNINARLKGYAYSEPHLFSFGARYDFSGLVEDHLAHFAADLDFEYRYYNRIIAASAEVTLVDDEGGVLNSSPVASLKFDDAWSLRAAVSWMPVDEVAVSFGYAFEKTAIPAQRKQFNVLDSDRNQIAFGVTGWLPEYMLGTFGLGLSTGMQFDFYAPREMEKYEYLPGNAGFPAIRFEGFAFAWHGAILMRFE